MQPTTYPSSLTFPPATSLAEALAYAVQQNAEKRLLVFLSGDQVELSLTFAQVWASARRAAGGLVAAGIGAGDRVVLVGHHDPNLVYGWIGALILGAVPAICPYLPSQAPREGARNEAAVSRAVGFVHRCGARALLTPSPWQEVMGEALNALESPEGENPPCVVLPLDALASPDDMLLAEQVPYHAADLNETAYIQLTSGTTGEAKGTPITHAALLSHVSDLARALELGTDDIAVSWVPFSHDMGLMTQLLLPFLVGFTSVTIVPEVWVLRPRLLIQAANTYGATAIPMPTFGYAHCTQHIRDQDLVEVDLSRVRCCLVGAEVIPAATMESFVSRFAPYGLRATSIVAAYGLAEAVSAATVSPFRRGILVDRVAREALQRQGVARPVAQALQVAPNAGSEDAPTTLPWVSCGVPLADTRIEIVNGAGVALPEREVGRVVIYREGLGVTLSDLPGAAAPGVVYTRDIGYLADGELYLCGRQDDLIILGGANVYPEAIEMTALAAIGEEAGRAAAFAIRDRRLSTETAVLICEVRGVLSEERARALSAAIRRAVRAQHELVLGDLWLVRRGWIEISESGKVARKATRTKYELSGRMASLAFLPEIGHLGTIGPEQVGALAQALADRVALMLGLTGASGGVGVHDDVFELGMTSLAATAIMSRLRRERSKSVLIERWVEQPTCAHLASLLLDTPYIEPASAPPTMPDPPPILAEVKEAEAPLLPSQAVAASKPIPEAFPEVTTVPLANALFGAPRNRNRAQAFLWNRFVTFGPMMERFGGFALPYGFGTRLQRAWLSQRWVQETFFSSELQLLSEWLQAVNRPTDAETVLRNLMFNTWLRWRRKAFQQADVTTRWLKVSGALPRGMGEGRAENGRGTVYTFTHTGGRWTIYDLMRRAGRPMAGIGYSQRSMPGTYTKKMVSQLVRADEVLDQGGFVYIASDSWNGKGGALVDLGGGRLRELRPGAAELAARHDADLVPVEARLEVDGVMYINFLDPIKPSLQGNTNREVNLAAALNTAHAAYYRDMWAGSLEYQQWHILRGAKYRDQLMGEDEE